MQIYSLLFKIYLSNLTIIHLLMYIYITIDCKDTYMGHKDTNKALIVLHKFV